MSIYSRKRRFFLAAQACVALCGLFWVFRLVTSPFLDVERKDVTNIGETRVVVHEWRQDAAEWFPENKWVADAKKHFRDRGRYLFCNNFDLNDANSQIDASPIAMLWRTESEDIPIRLVANAASLRSSEKLLSGDAELGAVTAARLSGNVVIRGADNLWIQGDSFLFEKESMKLWSGSPIRFRWKTHHGSATGGIEIQLTDSDTKADKLDISNLKKIQLLGTVVCHCFEPPRKRGDDAIELDIKAPNGFSYDVMLKTARFMGRQGANAIQRLNAKDSVSVLRKTETGGHDRLVCPELVMEFVEEMNLATGKPLPGKLKPSLIKAWGREVYVESPERELKVLANRVRYFLDARRLEIETTAVSGRNDVLRVKQKNSYLKLPPTQPGDPAQIQVLHMAGGGVQKIEIVVPPSQRRPNSRPGRITSTVPAPRKKTSSKTPSKPKDMAITAEWGESLLVQLAPDGVSRIVKFSGGARVSEQNMGFGLTADTIAMKILGEEESEEEQEQEIVNKDVAGVKTVSSSSPVKSAAEDIEFNFSNLTPEVLTAVGNVQLESEEGNGRLRDRLTVEFEQVETLPKDSTSSADESEALAKSDDIGFGEKKRPEQAVSFDADTLKATVQVNPANQMSFREVWLNGDVKVERESQKVTEAFTAFGNQLHAANGLINKGEISLFGDPARVISSKGKLEGLRIDLKQIGRQANVVGSGSIRFVTDKGLGGAKLAKPAPIDIYWSDRMEFQNKSANFVGSIRVFMDDENGQAVEVKCDGLTVHFSEQVTLGERDDAEGFAAFEAIGDKDSRQAGKIETIEFHDKVVVAIDQLTDGVKSGHHTATFADLVVDLQTGDFAAIGPGNIKSMSPDKEDRLQATPSVTVRANSPAQTTETAFIYTHVEFIGELLGNLDRKEAELTQNVIAIVTPARHVDEEIDLEIVSTEDFPERAGILRADVLNISSLEQLSNSEDARVAAFSMTARHNARLESLSISARADEIVYDHSKEQFIMKAEGDGRVTVNHRQGPRGKYNRFTGKRCEYYVRTKEIKGDRINGFDVTE